MAGQDANPGLSRRRLLRLAGAGVALSWFGRTAAVRGAVKESVAMPKSGAGVSTIPAVDAVDHLLLAVPDLDAGIAWVERRTGVRAVFGGSHPGRGTRNALLSLGGRRYLEILAPDPAQAGATSALAELTAVSEPRLVAWAAASSDLDAFVAHAKAGGLGVEGPAAGQRARPDGRMLSWRAADLTGPEAAAAGSVVPFFIEWSAGTPHPSNDSPAGCVLDDLRFEHPDPERCMRLLRLAGIAAAVVAGKAPGLHAVLATAKGRVELS